MRANEKKNLIKSGLFVLAMFIVFMIFTVTIGKESSWFAQKTSLKAILPSASSLKVGAVVEFKGIKIGTVQKIKVISATEVGIDFSVKSEYTKFIKMDSKVTINTKGLVGDKLLEIINGSNEAESVQENSVLFADDAITMEQVMVKGEKFAETASRVFTKLDYLLEQINSENKVEKMLKELQDTSKELRTFSKTMNQTKVLQKISSMSEKIDKVMEKVIQGPGTMHSLIYQDSVYNQLDKILGGAGRNKVLNYFIKDSIEKSEKK